MAPQQQDSPRYHRNNRDNRNHHHDNDNNSSASSSMVNTALENTTIHQKTLRTRIKKIMHASASSEPHQHNNNHHHIKKHSSHKSKIPKDVLKKCFSQFQYLIQQTHIEHYFASHPQEKNKRRWTEEDLASIEHLHIYDFDGTLYETLLPEEGIPLYESITGRPWPYGVGWWSKHESISAFSFLKDDNDEHVVKEGEALEHYLLLKAQKQRHDLIVMMTGRKNSLKRSVIEFLSHRLEDETLMPEIMCFKPDEFGSNTLGYKVQHIYAFCNSLPNLKFITIWEDRVEHANRFKNLNIKNFTLNTSITIDVKIVGKEKDNGVEE
ncbi:hypothetical protein FDP41_002091 [Naegleria fowleri]|uniref:Swiss Army Knife RNA repair protein HAD domain-containing protein n=1 Tax=Naegleria fowleri TaxID=5763 RepID=A0A6A5BX02_NAEFO|nr:uncharacterized protein FDP41_002091 [Naegleria fowleri]KAF0979021.1 hypothetical protein FDP41_002091 [Naegleria fowleri]CAG4712806.1 unnamed protein product [Naegleria fowleri]